MINGSCQILGCTGVYEFIGEQDSLGSKINFAHYTDETEWKNHLNPAILIYRCSRCSHIVLRSNTAFENQIKEFRTNYYNSKFVKS